jgi:PAS domain S-box-containing protein
MTRAGLKLYVVPLVTGLTGVALSLTIFSLARGWEDDRAQLEFAREASRHTASIERTIKSTIGGVRSIKALYRFLPSLSLEQFQQFTTVELDLHPSLQALEWIPRVPLGERSSYEESMRSRGFETFTFQDRQTQGTMVPSANRAVYYPVYYIMPYAGNEAAHGFDLGSNPTRLAALNQARDTGMLVVTERITLVQETGDQFGVLVFDPVYRGGVTPEKMEARQRNLLGFALGVLRVGDLVDSSLAMSEGNSGRATRTFVFDTQAQTGRQLLYPASSDTAAPGDLAGVGCLETTVGIGARNWAVLHCPPPAGISVPRFTSWSELAGGLLLTLLLVLYLAGAIRRSADVHRLAQGLLISEAFAKRSAEDLAQLIDTANAPIFGVDSQGVINEWNRAAAQATGYEKEEAIGRSLADEFVVRKGRDAVRQMITDVLGGQDVANYDLRLTNRRGKILHLLANITARRDHAGDVVGVIGVGQDITERRQQEARLAQSAKLEAVGQLTGGVAHDFNNLLTVVLGNLTILREDYLQDQVEELALLDDAIAAGETGAELTRQLLAFARSQELEVSVFDVGAVLRRFQRLLRHTLGENIELRISAPESEPLMVSADPRSLESALLNLSVNARDAMPGGGVLSIEVSRSEPAPDATGLAQGVYAAIVVTDTGVGMAAEVVERAFDPFFTTKAVGEGTGLGLSMVHGFAEQSGGTVSIDSGPGAGTCITLYLPVLEAEPDDVVLLPSLDQVEGRGTVLVAEDLPKVRAWMIRALTSMGYEVVDVENAAEALKRLRDGLRPKLLITDIVMPGPIDGLGLAHEVRESFPGVDVVLVTGYSRRDKNQTGLIDGFPVLRKPFSRRQLAQVLDQMPRS